jgi:hypothetical protein
MAGERLWFFQPEWIQSSLLNKYIEGGLGDRHVAPASNKSFDREPVVVRLEDPGIETEGERAIGARLQVTFAPGRAGFFCKFCEKTRSTTARPLLITDIHQQTLRQSFGWLDAGAT